MRILIVEDDAETSAFVAQGLTQAGHQVTTTGDGRDGLFKATGGDFEAIIVDRMLPGLNGLAMVKALRAAGDTTPILMLTAVGGIADRVEGLENGADDYLVKPFAFSELAARLNALARRPAPRGSDGAHQLKVADIVLDLHRRTVERAGQRIH
ncbi:MAG: response regulator transcription factor, partial [Pseudomonadota bacterium]|nr:response regulator transcription factor [Pseudomonadota bacterium]